MEYRTIYPSTTTLSKVMPAKVLQFFQKKKKNQQTDFKSEAKDSRYSSTAKKWSHNLDPQDFEADDRRWCYLSSVISVCLLPIVFGTAYVPVRIFETGDGIFVQFMMCLGLLFPCFICQIVAGSSAIFYYAMIGGGLYAVANVISLYIMEGLGMMLGSLLWNISICLVSWGFARFGVFGSPEIPNNNYLNIAGILLLIFGAVLSTMVRNTPIRRIPHPLMQKSDSTDSFDLKKSDSFSSDSTINFGKATNANRYICVFLCGVAGLFYGNILAPVKLMTESGEVEYPKDVKAYLFSFALGALFTSTLIFVVYTIAKKNVPILNPNIAIPSLVSGTTYGTGVCLLAVAYAETSQIVAFPVAAMSPGIVNAVWAILLFKEITGRRNVFVLIAALAVTCVGIVLLAVSNQ